MHPLFGAPPLPTSPLFPPIPVPEPNGSSWPPAPLSTLLFSAPEDGSVSVADVPLLDALQPAAASAIQKHPRAVRISALPFA